MARTTSVRSTFVRPRLVSITQCVGVREERTPSASLNPPSIRYRTTTRVPISTWDRKSRAEESTSQSIIGLGRPAAEPAQNIQRVFAEPTVTAVGGRHPQFKNGNT